jgi:hypothetical protein
MTVNTRATVDVSTPDLRAALKAVAPHVNKLKTDDHSSQHRVRLVFDGWNLFVLAGNGHSSALATIDTMDDSRINQTTNQMDVDDGPMTFDLQPRHVQNILQMFKAKPSDPEVGQLIRFTLDTVAGTIALQDVGGLYSAGEVLSLPVGAPADAFPDVAMDVSRAVSGIGADPTARALEANGKLLALFKTATDAYRSQLYVIPTGTDNLFVVFCGADFVGLVQSDYATDDSTRKWESIRRNWIELLPSFQLKVA